ncbi:low molecular weight phosphatase family protein [Hellea sp.]|nr:low molecular weight phosphatase family protein [Hellea sp.]
MAETSPDTVLFVCYLNSIRSPMAEGLMRKLFPHTEAQSCGIAAGDLDELMVAVMREKGVDMSGHTAQTLADMGDKKIDLVIAFTEAAGESAKAAFADSNARIEVWPLPDPTQGSLDVRAMMNNYRAIRDNIEGRLKRAFVI